jgi:hypothetical protein
MAALVKIDEVYEPAFFESSDIIYKPSTDFRVEGLEGAVSEIKGIVEQKKSQMGRGGINPLELTPEERRELNRRVKADTSWQIYLADIVDRFAPGFEDLDAATDSINRTWFNSVLLFSRGDEYDPSDNTLKLDATAGHSYITQMLEQGLLPDFGYGSASVINLLMAEDCFLLGVRDGTNKAHTIMTVPAGSAEFHTGKNPLFESIYAEFGQETGLMPCDIEEIALIGKISGHEIGGTPHYVFCSNTLLSISEVVERWFERAIDRREHRFLVPIPKNPSSILKELAMNSIDTERIDKDNRSETTIGNVNTMLAQCGGALVTYLGWSKGRDWLRETMGIKTFPDGTPLSERYVLDPSQGKYHK